MATDDPGLMLFIPMYNCAPQVPRVLSQVVPYADQFAEVFVVDNGSTDGGPQAAMEAAEAITGCPVVVVQNNGNYNLGGSHKVAMQRCIEKGYRGLVVFHGDDQGTLADLMDVLPTLDPQLDCVLGARFMPGSTLKGYAPLRIGANVVFNGVFSAISLRQLWDLGSGLNYYRREFLERRLWVKTGNDLTFNYYLILRTAVSDATIAFVPITWREDDQISNAKLVPHGIKMLKIIRDFTFRRRWWLDQRHDDFEGVRGYTVLNE